MHPKPQLHPEALQRDTDSKTPLAAHSLAATLRSTAISDPFAPPSKVAMPFLTGVHSKRICAKGVGPNSKLQAPLKFRVCM